MTTPIVEFDVETRGLQWYDQPKQEVFLVQFFCPELGQNEPLLLRHPEERVRIQAWLEKDAHYRAWNAKFDLHHLEAAGYTLPPEDRWLDGLPVAHAVDERRAVGLQAVGNGLFGEESAGQALEDRLKAWISEEEKRRRKESKATGEQYVAPTYADVPWDIMEPYAAHDVTLQRRNCDAVADKLDDLREVVELERECLPALYHVERRGFRVDRAQALVFEAELERELDQRERRCRELAGDEEFNPGSGKQLAEALEERGADLTGIPRLKSGLVSTASEWLEHVPDPLAEAIMDFRETTTIYTRYIWPLLNPDFDTDTGYRAPYLAADGRLHTDLRQVGARTGRMSSSPNVQNWPRDDLRMRHLVQASEGHKLVAVDLDNIELRLFAAFLGPESKVLKMQLDPSLDMHEYTARMIGLTDFDRGGGAIETARQRGKKFNYSVIYGAGVKSIAAAFGVKRQKAKEMLFAYHDAFPEVGEFQDRIEANLEDRGYLRTPFGRKHRVYNQRQADREAYKFGNYLIQGTAADLFKMSVVRCHKLGVPMVALTHDEILADVPEHEADGAAATIVDALCDHPRITKLIPLTAEAKIVDRWSQAKDPNYDPGWEARCGG